MIRKKARLLVGLMAAIVLSMTTLSGALGYTVPVAATMSVTGPSGPISCDQQYDFAATLTDANGQRVPGATVTWSIVSAPAGAVDSITPLQSVSDSTGVARTKIQFGAVPGNRTIRAAWNNTFTEIVVNPQNCQVEPLPRLAGRCATALGTVALHGPFSTATKVQVRGRYITWRLSFGPSYAGRSIQISHALRTPKTDEEVSPSNPVTWSAFTNPTVRIADANGDAYIHFRFYRTEWISVRGFFPGTDTLNPKITLACQGRWV